MYSPSFIRQIIHRYIDEKQGTVSNGELRVPCPSHGEKNASFSINLSSGLYKCFVPECKLHSGGNIQHFVAVLDDTPIADAKFKLDQEYELAYPRKKTKTSKKFPYTQEHITTCMDALLNNPEKLSYAQESCLWTEDTIRRFEIGYNEGTNRYWFPIKQEGVITNIRRYDPFATGNKVTSVSGTKVELFPMDNLAEDELYLMEGEKDCVLANQLGLNAITSTGGCGHFDAEWKEHFSGKNVYICYDIDPPGRNGAWKVAGNLLHVAKMLKIITLDISTPKNADFTDYIKSGKSIQDFMKLVDEAEPIRPESDAVVHIDDEVTDATLDQIDSRKLFYKRTKTNVRVIGTESAPFIIPHSMSVACNKDNGKICLLCRVGDSGGARTVVISETTPRILDLIECATREKERLIRDIFEIPSCKRYKYVETDHQSISRVSVIPSIDDIEHDEVTQNQTYVERELYFIGKSLVANTDYEIETLTMPSPKDQSLVHLGYKVKYADTSIEEFCMTPELRSELEVFQCSSETNSKTSMTTSVQT
jgi:hypothetical protein